jgi:hypothetical protein
MSPFTTPGGTPLAQADAVARVLAQDPRFAGMVPLDPDLIGQSAWYEVGPAVVGWRVSVTIGWGDCQAGCISRHVWVYDVDADGTVTLVEERGDPFEDGSGGAPGSGGEGDADIAGSQVAGRPRTSPMTPASGRVLLLAPSHRSPSVPG